MYFQTQASFGVRVADHSGKPKKTPGMNNNNDATMVSYIIVRIKRLVNGCIKLIIKCSLYKIAIGPSLLWSWHMTNQSNRSTPTLLRLNDVLELTGFRKTKLYDLIKAGDFPAPVKLGNRLACWPDSEVSDWISQQINRPRTGGKV